MLEQRRAKEKGYITLKEAAELTGYTSDYVGQLVRAGKIKGEQVYSGVAWVTTEDEVSSYLLHKGKNIQKADTMPFFERSYFTFFLYSVISLCVIAMLFLQYVFYVSIDSQLEKQLFTEAKHVYDESS